MKNFSLALQGHLNSSISKMATCLRLTWRDSTVYGFTTHDRILTISGVDYIPARGLNTKDLAANLNLDTDNTDVQAFLEDPVTEDNIRAGRHDYATYRIFQVNWSDLTMGDKKDSTGHIAQITVNRLNVVAELLGLMEAYGTSIGEITSPGCRANLGDQRCKVVLEPPVWAPLTGYNVTSVFDASLRDVVAPTVYNGFFFYCGTPGTSGATEPTWALTVGAPTADGSIVWTTGLALTVIGSITTADLDLFTIYDTARTEADGFFGEGVIEFTSDGIDGKGNGLSYDIKKYEVGKMVTKTPLHYDMTGATYTMHAGCDKQRTTCRDGFFNIHNMRAEPWLRGPDVALQVGRHS